MCKSTTVIIQEPPPPVITIASQGSDATAKEPSADGAGEKEEKGSSGHPS